MRVPLFAAALFTATSMQAQDAIFYSSLNHAVQLGQFDGVATVKELKQHGTIGLGSSDRIGSELVMINDTAYSLAADGTSSIMPPEMKLAFATAKKFVPEFVFEVSTPMNLEQFQVLLDSLIDNNRFAALQITGSFDSISYKCYLPQQKPYKPIREASSKIFNAAAVSGDIVGFYTPRSSLILSNPVYHFHFINQSRTGGGHVMAAGINHVKIAIDYADRLEVALPSAEQMRSIDLNSKPETE